MDLNSVMNGEPPEVVRPVEKTRVDKVKEMLASYPLEEYDEWYKANHPDIYAAYLFVQEKFAPKQESVKKKAKISLKTLGILLGIIGVFAVVVIVVLMYLMNQGLLLFQ